MTETLVERLRKKTQCDAIGTMYVHSLCVEAADRIEALETKDSARTKEHNLLVAENKSLERELAEARKVEIRTDPCGALDEVVSSGAHLEQMANNSWFLSIGEVNVWLNAKGKITATYEDNRTG